MSSVFPYIHNAVLNVKSDDHFSEQRTMMLQHNSEMEYKHVILSQTFTVLRRSTCRIQVVNMGDEDVLISSGLQVGAIPTSQLQPGSENVGARNWQ